MRIVVSIILLNYNGKQFNNDCLDSILAQNYQDFEIIFVDQCSTDGSLEEVENIYKKEIKSGKIKIVKNSENNGFTGGNNLGVKYANKNSKYICLLNNDTVVQKDWLEKMVQSIEKDKKLGAVSCLILDKGFEEKEKNQIFVNHKKCVSSFLGEFVFANMSEHEIKNGFYYTSGLCGCCFMYKNDLVDEPFPGCYFAYAEDVYLGWLIICKGYKLGVCFDTYINHYGSGSFGKRPSDLKLFHGNKNQIINYLIFYPLSYRIFLFPLFFLKELGYLFMGQTFKRIFLKFKAIKYILMNHSKINEYRLSLNKCKLISTYEFFGNLSFKLQDSFNINNLIGKIILSIVNFICTIYLYLIKLILYIVNSLFGK